MAMGVETIASLDDPRVACYRNLKDRELARAGGLFIAEGELLVRRLLASKLATESVLVSDRRAGEVVPTIGPGITVYVAPDALVHELLGFHFHSGVMACGRRGHGPTLEEVMTPRVQGGGRVTLAICPDTANTRNLGAIIRVCAAFGVDALVLGQYCCDPFFRQ
jgi:tRNA G18 (ribose-2'-O)-methylase SpoU